MTPALQRFYDVIHADDLEEPFDSSERCHFEVDTDSLPEEWGEWCCFRPIWNGNDHCIWHTKEKYKSPKDLHRAQEYERSWPQKFSNIDPTRRLDETDLRGYQVDTARVENPNQQPLSFSGCTMFSSNFYGSDMTQSSFQNVDLNYSNFEHSNCKHVFFQGCDLSETTFEYARLENVSLLRQPVREANWVGVNLNDTNLHDSDFTGTNLRLAKLKDAYMTKASLQDSNLEEAELENTDLRDVNLRGAKLSETLVRQIRINEGTEFGGQCAYEREADDTAAGLGESTPAEESSRVLTRLRRFTNRALSRSEDGESLQKSIRVYRLYQRLLREASLPDDIRRYRVRERHTQRKRSLRKSEYIQWFKLSFDRWVMLYGESPSRVIGTSLITILGFSLLFHVVGQLNPAPSTFSEVLYFSVITFTTLGYGDFQPATEGARVLASVESLSGALLMALLVFVLGRRATW